MITTKKPTGADIANFRYANGEPVNEGDKVSVVDFNQYVGGGNYKFDFDGVVKDAMYGGLVIQPTHWRHHYDCSQRFGCASKPSSCLIYLEYNYGVKLYYPKSNQKIVKIN